MLARLLALVVGPIPLFQAALAALVVTFGVTAVGSWFAYEAGWRHAADAYEAATAAELKRHGEWLTKITTEAGALDAEDANAELSNEQKQKAIERALLQNPNRGSCVLDADRLRPIFEIR